MRMGSEVRADEPKLGAPLQRKLVAFPCEAVPYLLSTADALIVLFASLFGGFTYHWVTSTPMPDLSAYFALGLVASFVHIVRMGGRGYYDFESAAKPTVEIVEVLISWFTTGLMLAFFAFLFKIGESFSRGSFLIFLVVAPVGLLAERRVAKALVKKAAAGGTIGKRNMVLLGDQKELDALEQRDLLAFFGAGEVNRFTLSADDDPLVQHSNNAKTLELDRKFYSQKQYCGGSTGAFVERHCSNRIDPGRYQDASGFRKTAPG